MLASKHQKTDLLGFEEVYSVAREAKNKLHTVSPTELNGILRKFFAEVKRNKKTDLTPSALTGIRAAIHRTITGQPISRSINILKDVEFTQANKMFEVVCKSYYKRGNPKPQHKNPIEVGDMEKLNSYFSNDCPDKLQVFVWFNLCYYLGRRGREGWRELRADLHGTTLSHATTAYDRPTT